MDTPDPLLLASFEPELARLGKNPPKGWRVALTGVGGIAAAVATARLLMEARPARVLFIGTCGMYGNGMNNGNGLNIGDCIAVSEAVAVSVTELQDRAFRPRLETTVWRPTWDLPLPKFKVAATPAITSNPEDAKLLGKIADVEHLETASVFAACHLANVPAAAALIVANRAEPGGHAEWAANHEELSRQLAERLIELNVFEPG
jgi:purine-nucleoside phosphorylase